MRLILGDPTFAPLLRKLLEMPPVTPAAWYCFSDLPLGQGVTGFYWEWCLACSGGCINHIASLLGSRAVLRMDMGSIYGLDYGLYSAPKVRSIGLTRNIDRVSQERLLQALRRALYGFLKALAFYEDLGRFSQNLACVVPHPGREFSSYAINLSSMNAESLDSHAVWHRMFGNLAGAPRLQTGFWRKA